MNKFTKSDATTKAFEVLNKAVEVLEKAHADGKSSDTVDALLKSANEAAKTVNACLVKDATTAFIGMAEKSLTDFYKAYMADWTIEAVKVAQHDADNGGDWHVESVEKRLDLSTIDRLSKKTKLTVNGAWTQYLEIFIDNCVCDMSNEIAQDGRSIAIAALVPALIERRNTNPLFYMESNGTKSPAYSNGALLKQLDAIVGMIFPAEIAPKMSNSDCKFIRKAAMNYKTAVANGTGKFKVSTTRALERVLFDSIHSVMNNKAWDFEREFHVKETANPDTTRASASMEGSNNAELNSDTGTNKVSGVTVTKSKSKSKGKAVTAKAPATANA